MGKADFDFYCLVRTRLEIYQSSLPYSDQIDNYIREKRIEHYSVVCRVIGVIVGADLDVGKIENVVTHIASHDDWFHTEIYVVFTESQLDNLEYVSPSSGAAWLYMKGLWLYGRPKNGDNIPKLFKSG